MKWIKKGKEPTQLKEYRNSGGEWDDFSLEKGKEELKDQLLTEQKSLCAYCMGAIRSNTMKVEHWHPRAIYPNKKLDYKNLLAVCQGCYGSGTTQQQHCDTSKGDRIVEINPQEKNHINALSYKNNGEIYSTI
ncbi:MAG: retron system putative HNH endonuclease, partial [Chitinophagales bacterium]